MWSCLYRDSDRPTAASSAKSALTYHLAVTIAHQPNPWTITIMDGGARHGFAPTPQHNIALEQLEACLLVYPKHTNPVAAGLAGIRITQRHCSRRDTKSGICRHLRQRMRPEGLNVWDGSGHRLSRSDATAQKAQGAGSGEEGNGRAVHQPQQTAAAPQNVPHPSLARSSPSHGVLSILDIMWFPSPLTNYLLSDGRDDLRPILVSLIVLGTDPVGCEKARGSLPDIYRASSPNGEIAVMLESHGDETWGRPAEFKLTASARSEGLATDTCKHVSDGQEDAGIDPEGLVKARFFGTRENQLATPRECSAPSPLAHGNTRQSRDPPLAEELDPAVLFVGIGGIQTDMQK
ncbi:hypothetical protein DFH09DRAFT_1088118 [Mycena vulgaris]|nr:hypothetical protein DFH09DRAFT_1088118 [Mycena vulgaris]